MKPIFFLFLPLFAILLTTSDSICQQDSSKRSVTVVYSKVGYQRTQKDKEIFNLIKVNPLLVLNGDMPIYYERRITDHVSLEGSVGFTYNDILYQAFNLSETEVYNEDRKFKPGFSGSGAIKYYPSNYTRALDEFYFGAEVRYRRYNSEIPNPDGTSMTNYIQEYRNLMDFKLIGGYIAYISDRVIADIYGGFGMRMRNHSLAYYDTNSANPDVAYDRINDVIPTISLGVKFGFGF